MSKFPRRDLLRLSAAAGLPAAWPGQAAAAWPDQPIRLICPFAAGGPTDVAARLVAEALGSQLPQRVVVENRTGSGVVVGTEAVARAPRDGHTLLYNTIAHAVLRALFHNLSFDPVADFRPVALVGTVPMLLMVNRDFPARTLPELVALFRDKPGQFNYGSSGNGGAVHLATELFLRQAGQLRVNHIPYRGSAPAMPDLLNGNLTMFLNVASDGIESVRSGATRGLAVSGDRRLPQLPDVPTFAEAGMPGYEAYTWHMVLAPAGTPAAVVTRLNEAINAVLRSDALQQRFAELSVQPRPGGTPEDAAAWLKAEMEKWEPVVRAAGIVVN
ncbi:Bug family tripartite tricarboxylate transporter substrate binding protein [Pseudoroseomonas sp. WGS1072]|uniref:Bug family tripartite tricarboxylate transporter substrate binding protein n=1 Tax=Roseomonas sp. WGS1072 TaxID=3366816 RepID=UPI003BEF7AB5